MRGFTYYTLIGLIAAGPPEVMGSRAELGRALGVTRARVSTLLRQAKEAGVIHPDFLPDMPQMKRRHDPGGLVVPCTVLETP